MNSRIFSKSFSLKSAVTGFLAAVLLILAIGAGGNENQQGKYQCCPAGDSELAVFIINTQTGETWRLGRGDTFYFGTPQQRQSIRQSEVPIAK